MNLTAITDTGADVWVETDVDWCIDGSMDAMPKLVRQKHR